MRTLLISPLLWRMVGGFVVGTALTFGLAPGQDQPRPRGAAVELAS